MAGLRVPSRRSVRVRRDDRLDDSHEVSPLRRRLRSLSWPIVAALAALATVFAGLVPPVALAVTGWVEAPDVGFGTALVLGARGWLLGHGAPADFGSVHLSMAPLGVAVVALLTGTGLAGMAARRAAAVRDEEPTPRLRRNLAAQVAGVFTGVYAAAVLAVSLLAGLGSVAGRAVLGAVVLAAVASLVGAGRELSWDPTRHWPVWARAIPRAVAAALFVMVGTGALVALVALLTHRSQVVALHDALVPGVAGGIVLVLLQLVWLPNMVLWCASWALGAGFRVGQGTLVSPSYNLTAMLPSLPVLGAIGPNGPGRPWALLWMLSGVLAGGVAAWVVVRGLRRAVGPGGVRFDASSLVGGLAGAISGLLLVVLAALGNGALGTQRLTEVGSRLAPLAVMAPVLMGLSGLGVGLVLGLVDRRAASSDEPASDGGATVAPAPSTVDD